MSGRVERVGWTRSKKAVNVEFDGPNDTRLMVWVSSNALTELQKAVGGDVEKLAGSIIVMRGKLTLYSGVSRAWANRLEIEFTAPGQLQVMSPAPSPSSATAAVELNASDLDVLHKHVGEQVTVTGHIQRVSWTRSKNAANVEFDGPDETRLMVWVGPAALPLLKKAVGDDLEKALSGAQIVCRGKLHLYSGSDSTLSQRLQIDFKSPDELQVASPASSPRSATAAIELNASDLDLLHKHVGKQITVTGHVQHVSWTGSKNAANVEFDGPDETKLMVWVGPAALPLLKKAVGDDLEKALLGAQIACRGKLHLYGGKDKAWTQRLQIDFKSPDQLQIVAPPAGSD